VRSRQAKKESGKIGSLRGGGREGLCPTVEEEEKKPKGRGYVLLAKKGEEDGEQCGEGGLSGWFRRDSPRKKMAGAKKGNATLLKKMKA